MKIIEMKSCPNLATVFVMEPTPEGEQALLLCSEHIPSDFIEGLVAFPVEGTTYEGKYCEDNVYA